MPTTNPVPSTDPTDLLFNAGKLDEVINGTANSFTDRLGATRRTVAGMNADFDAQLADAESDLNVYRADAAASASQALGYLNVIRATSYGAYASDPATDPLGNPPTVGDEYFNTTANLLKRWNGTTWQASDINTANLAAPSGSSLVGYMPAGTSAVATTVQEKLRKLVTSPEDFGAIGDGASHPLSTRFSTLAAAQAIYPHATALTDEIDWCAWRAAINAIYNAALTDSTAVGQNVAQGKIEASGQYVINKPIVVDLLKLEIVGKVAPRTGEFVLGKSSCIKYNGPAGTVDAPVYMFDCLTQTELGAAPAGRLPQNRGISVKFSNFGFFGNFASMNGAPSVTNFISAIRIRSSSFSSVESCTFGGTLYDGIVFTGLQLFTQVNDCFFYGVHRDAIKVCQYSGDFSTTVWIFRNEFGYVGRYAILMDMTGSIEAMPVVRNNSFEHTFTSSYYFNNRSWFVQGAITGCCFVNCGNMVFADNRFEGTYGCVADVHLIACNAPSIRDSIIGRLLISTLIGAGDTLTTQARDYLTANGFYDVTDSRNIKVGTSTNFKSEIQGLAVSNVSTLAEVILVDGIGLSNTGYCTFINAICITVSLPIANGLIDTDGVKTRIEAPQISALSSFVLARQSIKNASTNATPFQLESHQICGPIISAKISAQDGNPEIQLFREFWLRFANLGWGPPNGYKGWTLNRLAGDATQEGNYIDQPLFFALPRDSAGNVVGAGQYEAGVITKRKIRYEYTAAPASGTWKHGDICYNSYPLAGGVIGWVCVAPGTPGTWKSFGAISA